MEVGTIVITVIGDGTVGKTCLIKKFIGEELEEQYIPTVLEDVRKQLSNHVLHIKDTAGQDEYARLRVLAYPETNVFVICFSLCDMNSYKNVKVQWRGELSHYKPDTPFVLVGTKLDDQKKRVVSHEDGVKLKKDVNALFYVECSAMDGTNINRIFESAVKAHLAPKNRKKRNNNCLVL